jgi:DNA-binding NarL/FixJ family response regulator
VLRVLVVDDVPSFRVLLRYLLVEDGDIEVAGEAGDVESALQLAAQTQPDVVLTDVHMDGGNALDHVAALRDAGGGAKVVVISGIPEAELAAAARDAGADGHIEKAAAPDALRAAVRAAAA